MSPIKYILFFILSPPRFEPIVKPKVRQPKYTHERSQHYKHIVSNEEDNKIDHHPSSRVLLFYILNKISKYQSKVANGSHYHLVAQLNCICGSVLVWLGDSKIHSYKEVAVEQKQHLYEWVILTKEY